jgi:hypothetical protein
MIMGVLIKMSDVVVSGASDFRHAQTTAKKDNDGLDLWSNVLDLVVEAEEGRL